MISTREVFAFLTESLQAMGLANKVEPKLWRAIAAVASSDEVASLVGERSFLLEECIQNPPRELLAQLAFRDLNLSDLIIVLPKLQAIKIDFNVRFMF